MEIKTNIFYRVCHIETLQGLWYDYKGNFTGFIHDRLKFCKNNELKMDFDDEIVGWLSATDSLETLFHWFTVEDIKQLQKHGWFIHVFVAEDIKFYERFQHQIIKQDTSRLLKVLNIEEHLRDEKIKTLGYNEWLAKYAEANHKLNGWLERDIYLDELELPKSIKLSLIQKWLRESYKRRIYPTYSANGTWGIEIRIPKKR